MNVQKSPLRLDGRYLLESRIATGATAVVWRATDEVLHRRVAVKVLHHHLADDSDLASRFADEARLAATVEHRSLVRVYDTIAGPPPAIVLELVDGPDIRARLDAGRFTIAEVLGLGWAIADGLDVAHRAGLVHRDVKPANIICTAAGHPKLGDFGIATASAGDRTATGLVLGTAKYLAPEQVRGGPIDARTDVYALSVVLYEALCGKPPFERSGDLPTAMARLEDPPAIPRTIRPDTPIGVEAIVLRGLAREPDTRWPTAAALRDAIGVEAESLGLALATIDLRGVAHREAAGPGGEPTGAADRTRATEPPASAGGASAPHRRHSRWVPRLVKSAGFVAISALGALLVSAGNPVSDLLDRRAGPGADPVPVTALAFDPDGTGTPGEHDELAANVIDGDPNTHWNTESYDDPTMGAKRGVGLIIELAEPAAIDEILIESDGVGWAVAAYVADSTPLALEGWGPPRGVATGSSKSVTLRPEVSGRSLLLWITDLGEDGPPHRLEIHEVTIR